LKCLIDLMKSVILALSPLNVYEDESHEGHDSAEKSDTLLCAAVGTVGHQRGLDVCTVYGDRTVCSCGHSKSSAWVRCMYCVWRPYCVQL